MSKRPRPDNDDSLPAACDQCRVRKVRCDRGQPECSNCHKAGVECSSSNLPKRINQTKQLRDEFSIVLKQIGRLDQSLGTLTSLTRQIAADVAKPSSHSAQAPNLNFLGPVETNYQHNVSILDNQSPSNVLPSETVEFDQGGEYLYSYPAPMVLIKSLLRQATESLLNLDEQRTNSNNDQANNESLCNYFHALQNPDTRAALQQKLDDFPFKSPCAEFHPATDKKTMTTPPRLIVNASVDGYLRAINTQIPIFDDDSLRRSIHAHYSADSQPQNGMAWPLIMNAIVLLQLALEIRVSRVSHSNSRGISDGILSPFLENCDQAIRNIGSFMVPTIVNVKALLILTLVSREFFSHAAAQRACQAACQAGRALGLHRSKIPHRDDRTNGLTESEKERERLFWALYTLDKQRVFMTGQPCDLYIFDSDYGTDSHGKPECSLRDAMNHMMVVWEEIYLNVYSSKATSSNNETRTRQMHHASTSMKTFIQNHAEWIATYSTADPSTVDLLQVEFQYGCRVSQLLVLRSEQATEQIQNQKVEIARSALKLVVQVSPEASTPAKLAALSRMFRNYPIVAFIELVAFHIWHLFARGKYDSDAQTDITLLRAFCNRLQLLQLESLTHSFYARTKLGLDWALGTLQATGDIFDASLEPRAPSGPLEQRRGSNSSPSTFNGAHLSPADISNACNLRLWRDGSPLLRSLNPEQPRQQNGISEKSGLIPFNQHMGPAPRFSSPPYSYYSPSSSAPWPRPEAAHNQPPSHFEWGDANMDFPEEALAPENHRP